MKTLYNNFAALILAALIVLGGCGSQQTNQRRFFTSGNREADERADQRMANAQQLKDANGAKPAVAEVQKPLYDRLGGEKGINAIVDDWISRAIADPRVNWERKDVKKGGILHREKSVEWQPTEEKIAEMKKHIVQFFSLSTGGPSFYDGKEMKQAHTGMRITNPEFDAAVGDLKATLDKLTIPDKDHRELLAIIETTRTQIVEER
jgi:hemoglobin